MEGVAILYLVLIIAIVIFAVGSFLALPLIWLYVGHISRKLDKIIKLLEPK